MYRLFKTLVIVITMPLMVTAQKTGNRLHYFNITQFGWLLGDKQRTGSVQTINGVAIKKYFAGIGVAYDKYGYKSLPVFADLRYSLLQGKTSMLQVYGDAGINNPLASDFLPRKYSNGQDYHIYKKSFYGEAGITYLLHIGDNAWLTAGAGYNYKTFKYTEEFYTGSSDLTHTTTNYTYRYSKYVLRVGFGIK